MPKIQAPPPPPPKVPDVRQPGETGWWVEVNSWFPTQLMQMNKGHGATFTESGRITLQGKPKAAEGADVGIALGLHNTLHFSYWEMRAAGDIPAISNDLVLWGQTYSASWTPPWVSTNYRLQNGKVSFEYLTWPYPVESRRFRLKTLWEVQYTNIRTGFDAPKQPLVDNNGIPIVDANGNPISYAGLGSKFFIYPEFGLQAQYFAGRHLRLEANAAGFAFPHKDTVWDADASVNYRIGKVELRAGAKAFHFKTNPASDYYMWGTPMSAFVGLRWHSQ
jgi:hypothetical protein